MAHVYRHRSLLALLAAATLLVPLSGPASALATESSTSGVPKIQLALLLDTSNSMDGLIDQARQQLWQVVNEFARAKRNGVTPGLEVAVYEYGNDRLSGQQGYIRQVTPLTHELDQVSEALFSLTTDGGNEYCGYVIDTASRQLQWSQSSQDVKAIFIAGNEPFTQGPVAFQVAIEYAKSLGITVNTIHAGGHQEGANSGWRDAALLAGGEYVNIDHNQKVVHIVAPQDQRLAELNQQLNQTYLPYGQQGIAKAQRQKEQDQKSEAISPGMLAKRTQSKASSLYSNTDWDLVDALEAEQVDLAELAPNQLPAELQVLDNEDRKAYISSKSAQRKQIQAEIQTLSKARAAYINAQQQTQNQSKTLDTALIDIIHKQAKLKSFVFSNN